MAAVHKWAVEGKWEEEGNQAGFAVDGDLGRWNSGRKS